VISMSKTNPGVALVTGTSSGIGRATAKALQNADFRVFGTSRRAASERSDGLGLMDKLALRSAHVVGASMGGMIAQIIAAGHPDRRRSLVSIMSSSGDRRLPKQNPRRAMRCSRNGRTHLSPRRSSHT